MSIFVDEKNKVVVQGATGHQGVFHIGEMKNFGTKVVAGVTPGKAGQEVKGVPIFNNVQEGLQIILGSSPNQLIDYYDSRVQGVQ